MSSFVDKSERSWNVVLDFRAFRKIHAMGFDCADATQWERLATDPDLVINVLCELCRDDLSERGVTQEEFEFAFDLEVLGDALHAIVEAIIDFFPKRRRRLLKTTWAAAQAKSTELLTRRLDEMEASISNGTLDRQIESSLSERRFSTPR